MSAAKSSQKKSLIVGLTTVIVIALTVAGVMTFWKKNAHEGRVTIPHTASDGPASTAPPGSNALGSADRGRDVFRFETFGNEGFWTDAMRLPQGMSEAKLTLKDALEAGLVIDVEALGPRMRKALEAQAKTDLSAANAPLFNDPAAMVQVVNSNAVVGVVPKDTNGDGKIDIAGGDKVGISCAICHTVSDKSVLDVPGRGSIGRRIDGPAALTLNMGKLLALAANSRAYYPKARIDVARVQAGARG